MNTNPNNIIPASQNAQPTQAHGWELIELDRTITESRAFATPTGHCVEVHLTHHPDCSHVQIVVTDEIAFVNACNVHFNGVDHQLVSADFTDDYLRGYGLIGICEDFDELCIEFGQDDAA